jgi:dTDP-4-amino-4,6-dideoxygalactose transaminase
LSQIPLVDLKAQYRDLAGEIQQEFKRVCESTAFILGPDVAEFEREFGTFTGIRHVVGTGNGTDALEIALRAVGLGSGDEILVPTNSFVASSLAVLRAGARVVLVDCDEDFLMDPASAEARVTPRTKGIMPVHLFGQCVPMGPIEALSHSHRLTIVEDAAQAQGARQGKRGAGTFGQAAATSFYPGKNLGAYGDAGAAMTNDDAVAAKMRALRNYGSEVKYHHPDQGFNSRLDTLQAVVLRIKLRRLEAWNAARRTAAQRYHELLRNVPDVVPPRAKEGNEHIWHVYAVRVPRRDHVLRSLHDAGIGAGIHYPVPIHLQGAFAYLGHNRGDFPIAERLANEQLSLPIYPEITPAQQEEVVAALKKALA